MAEVAIVAVPETAGSALYGMVDVLSAVGNVWETLLRAETARNVFRVRIVSPIGAPFHCGNAIPVQPAAAIADDPRADIVILPELWLGPDDDLRGRYDELMEWIRRRHETGAWLYSACSGAVMLAATGLLDGCDATSHWGYEDLFRRRYPKVRFRPQPSLAFADPDGRIVTAGGTTSWHDLALHIIARHASPGEALRIAKVYLLKLHSEGQLPHRVLVRGSVHDDAAVRATERYLEQHFREHNVVTEAVRQSGLAERTLKRRFKVATGSTIIDYVQNLRIEEAKRLLEEGLRPVDQISFEIGYDDTSFFRRLFKRVVGLTPSAYRRMFAPLARPLAAA
ncbi:MAG: AraC family transcriptional regulator [Proteobacteria bacterium]|nr:MAG: AraC family transcriptional regulator [Pseudomonadota bacterium]